MLSNNIDDGDDKNNGDDTCIDKGNDDDGEIMMMEVMIKTVAIMDNTKSFRNCWKQKSVHGVKKTVLLLVLNVVKVLWWTVIQLVGIHAE